VLETEEGALSLLGGAAGVAVGGLSTRGGDVKPSR
jgi:hypothetical protein